MSPAKKRRHIGLIILGAVLAVIVLAAVGAGVSFSGDNGPAAYAATTSNGTIAQPDGTWKITSGEVGYRAKEKAFGIGHDVVGRTKDVEGTANVSGGSVSGATIKVQLTNFMVSGRKHEATSTTVNASANPTAVFTQTSPVKLNGNGKQTIDVPGTLSFNGKQNPVTWKVDVAPDDKGALSLVGNTTIDVTQWGVTPPSSSGVFAIDKSVRLEFTTQWSK